MFNPNFSTFILQRMVPMEPMDSRQQWSSLIPPNQVERRDKYWLEKPVVRMFAMPALVPVLDQDQIINVQSILTIIIILIMTSCVQTSFQVCLSFPHSFECCWNDSFKFIYLLIWWFCLFDRYFLLFCLKGDEVDVEMCDESTMMMVIPNGHHHHHHHHHHPWLAGLLNRRQNPQSPNEYSPVNLVMNGTKQINYHLLNTFEGMFILVIFATLTNLSPPHWQIQMSLDWIWVKITCLTIITNQTMDYPWTLTTSNSICTVVAALTSMVRLIQIVTSW